MLTKDEVGIENGCYGIYRFDMEGKAHFYPIGKVFGISRIEIKFEDDSIYLTFYSKYGTNIIRETIERNELNRQGMEKLSDKGFDVKNTEVFQMLVTILEDEHLAHNDMVSIHEGIGWDKVRKKKQKEEFKSSDGYVFKRFGYINSTKSNYKGDFDIKPKGTYEGQIEFIKDEIEGNVACEAVLAIGLSAVLVGRIKDIVHVTNLIVHIYGDSSRGKTTAAQLAVSVAGSPDLQKTSLMMSWHSTANAIITRLKMNRGMPVAMDEISKYQANDMTNIVYALSDGRDKERLNKDATLKHANKNDSFATTIISTGEATITSKCKNNTGIKARVIEIDAQITKDAKHAIRIKQGCMSNYGFLAPKLAKYMQDIGIDTVIERHTYWQERYMEKTTSTVLKERISAMYALILAAADLANGAFDIHLDVEGILDFLVETEQENDTERDIAKDVQEKLIEYAKSNRGQFVIMKNRGGLSRMPNDNKELLGRVEVNIDKPYDSERIIKNEYCFTRDGFRKIITKLGYEDEKVLLKKLKQSGYLNHEKDKLYRKRKLMDSDSTATKMYIIYEFQNIVTNDGDVFVVEDEAEIPF